MYAKKFSHFDDGMGTQTRKRRKDRIEDCNVRRRRWTRRRCVDLGEIRSRAHSVIPLDTSTDMFAVRLHDGVQWSSPINVAAFAFQKNVRISLVRRAQPLLSRPASLFEFCVSTEAAPCPFDKWTLIVTIQPYYRIYNCVQDKSFCVRQTGGEKKQQTPVHGELESLCIDPGKSSALYWYDVNCPSLLHIATTEDLEKESGALRIDTDSEFPIHIGNDDDEVYLIRIHERRIEIRREHQDVPMYRISNDSSVNILYNQAGSKRQHVLKQSQSRTIGWDIPARPPHLTIRVAGETTPYTFDMNRVGLQTEIKHNQNDRSKVSARTEADGPTLVLRIRDVLSDSQWIVLEKGRQQRRRRRRSTKLELQKELGIHDTKDDDDDVEAGKMSLSLIFTSDLGVSAVDESSVEIGYASLQGFRFAYNRTSTLESCGIVIGELQLDSYLRDTPFPVVIRGDRNRGKKDSSDSSSERKPMLFVQVSRKCGESLDIFENIDIQIRRTLHFHIDEAFVLALLSFLSSKVEEEENDDDNDDENRDETILALKQLNKLNENVDTSSQLNLTSSRERLYIKKLVISPVRFVVSFIAAIGSESNNKSSAWRTLARVRDAKIQLKGTYFSLVSQGYVLLSRLEY